MASQGFEQLEIYKLSETLADEISRLVTRWDHFAQIGRGPLYETRHFLRRAYRRQLLSDQQIAVLNPLIQELAPRLNAYIGSIGRKCQANEELAT